jgi:ribonuclease P protein component
MPKQRLTYNEKLHKPSEYQDVYKLGKRRATDFFVVFFSGDQDQKLGITVTKSVGAAHERNRIKRQVREFFRTNKKAAPNGRLIVKAKDRASGATNALLRGDLKKVLSLF